MRGLLLIAALASCGGVTEGDLRPTQTVSFTPSDVSTGLTELKVEVGVFGLPPPDGPALAADGLRLATWPGLVPLAATVSLAGTDAVTGEGGFPVSPAQKLTISASAPVPDGWYIAIVDRKKLVATARLSDPSDHHTLADGNLGVRVRVGSQPMLRGLNVCEKTDGTAVYVAFSEGVVADWAAGVPLAVHAGAADCRILDTPRPGTSPRIIGFLCPALAPGDQLDVMVSAGLSSATGVKVPETHLSARWSDLPAGVTGCRYAKREP